MKKYLADLIKVGGPISISTFMNEALFNPKLGYYNQENPFGKGGDFITSPEISQVFGELIGVYLISLWQNNYESQEVSLVEMGAGRGILMKDVLSLAGKIPGFLEKATVNIIEISPKLQEEQKKNLKGFNIIWWDNFSDFYEKNQDKPILFVANELFDCFAINQFVKTDKGWEENKIVLNEDGEFEFALAPHNKIIDQKILDLAKKNVKEGAVFEYASKANDLMQELSLAIKKSRGVAIIIDYGYIKNEFRPTLQALKNHKYSSVLKDVGSSDVTALVNFGFLQSIAKRNKIESSLITQKEFLESLGIEIRRQKLIQNKSQEEQEKISSAINRLVDPRQMGELFKCLIFWSH